MSRPADAITDAEATTPAVRPGRDPLAAAGASYIGASLSVLLIALGAVAVRDAVAAVHWIRGDLWLVAAADWLAALRSGAWVLPVGVTFAIAGVALVVVSVAPRRRPAVRIAANTPVYINLADVARIARAAAESVPGILSARCTATRRRVVVRCVVTGPLTDDDRQAIRDVIDAEFAALSKPPSVLIHAKTQGRR